MIRYLNSRRVQWQLHNKTPAHARTTLTSLSAFLEAWGEAADSLVASELVGSGRNQKLLFEEQHRMDVPFSDRTENTKATIYQLVKAAHSEMGG